MLGLELMKRYNAVHEIIGIFKRRQVQGEGFPVDEKLNEVKEMYPEKFEEYFQEADRISLWGYRHEFPEEVTAEKLEEVRNKFGEKIDQLIFIEREIEKLKLKDRAKLFFQELNSRYEKEIYPKKEKYITEEEYDSVIVLSDEEAKIAAEFNIKLETFSLYQEREGKEKGKYKAISVSKEDMDSFFANREKYREEKGLREWLNISSEYMLLNIEQGKIYEQLVLLQDNFDYNRWKIALMIQGKWQKKMIETNHGTISVEYYREIKAAQRGYSSYEEMKKNGNYIGDDFEGADRMALLKHYQSDREKELVIENNKSSEEEIKAIKHEMKERKLDLQYADSWEQRAQIRKEIEKLEEKHAILEQRQKEEALHIGEASNLENLLQEAKEEILRFCHREYETVINIENFDKEFENLTHIGLAYTETPDEKHRIECILNLKEYKATLLVDDIPVRIEEYRSEGESEESAIKAMIDDLKNRSFESFVEVNENELQEVMGLKIDEEGNYYEEKRITYDLER